MITRDCTKIITVTWRHHVTTYTQNQHVLHAKQCPSFLVSREGCFVGRCEGWRVGSVGGSQKVWSQWRLGLCAAVLEPYYQLGGVMGGGM